MTDDLVKRLRQEEPSGSRYVSGQRCTNRRNFDGQEAADLLEAQSARIAELEGALSERDATIERLREGVLYRDEARLAIWQAIRDIKIGNKTDDKLILENLTSSGFVIYRLDALALNAGTKGGDDEIDGFVGMHFPECDYFISRGSKSCNKDCCS